MPANPGPNLSSPVRDKLLRVVAWLIPLLTSAPSLFIWGGLMTIPLVGYLAIMLASLFDSSIRFAGQPVDARYWVSALDVLLLGGPHWPDKVISIVGLGWALYATLHLALHRKAGLVTSGPYRLVRNPQYVGVIAYLTSLTSRCYREVLGDVGWLGPTGTLLLWLASILGYVAIALVEELHLRDAFGSEYDHYAATTPFMTPLILARHRAADIALAILVPIALLAALLALSHTLY